MALAHWLDHLRLYLPADFTMPSYSALLAAYVLGGLTFLPLLICAGLYVLLYTTPPIGDPDLAKRAKNALQAAATSEDGENDEKAQVESTSSDVPPPRAKPLQGWLIARRTFEESASDATYIGMMRSFLDARSKDRRPRDTYYAVLKGTVLYLYEDEAMSECFAALDAGAYAVEIWPNDGLLDGELFAKRNCIRLSAKATSTSNSPAGMATVSKDMKLQDDEPETETGAEESSERKREKAKKIESILAEERNIRRTTAFDLSQPWHVFIKNNSEMEDWYLALVAASSPAPPSPNTDPLAEIFSTADMAHLVSTLDAQPDAIPTRWLNALLGRLFLSVHRTARVEAYILNRLASKLAKVKRPGFLTALSVRSVSVGSSAPSVSTPMLKELTKWGDAALELKFQFSGELRITIAATAEVSLGARFRPYVVQMVLAVIVRRVEGNVLVKVKRPPSNRIWYAFTTMPKLEIEVVPVVSDREIKWGVVLKPIETQLKEIIRESIVMPNMDDIPFFESTGYEHRGGIWPDAARRQYVPEEDDPNVPPNPALPTSEKEKSKEKVEEKEGTGSAPASVIGLTIGETAAHVPPTADVPAGSESTPVLPLSPGLKASGEGSVQGARSRSPSPSRVESEREKEKHVASAGEIAASPKRMSWFSRSTPAVAPADDVRGRASSTASTGSSGKPGRGRSAPRSSLLLEVEGGAKKVEKEVKAIEKGVEKTVEDALHHTHKHTDSKESNGAHTDTETTPTPSGFASSTTPTAPASSTTPTPIATSGRSTTPIVTINGTRRATLSHHASQSASGDFYTGGSVSTSSFPPAPTPTTSVVGSGSGSSSLPNSEAVSPSVGNDDDSTTREPSVSSATSSPHPFTPSDTPGEALARTSSNGSSTHSLSTPAPAPTEPNGGSGVPNEGNTSSFLATWKTRAADKQALSNTAKEAMKKWSVGWNNLKRNVEEERDRRRTSMGGVTANGGAGSGLEDEGSGSDIGSGVGLGNKAGGRKTFAEMRADVLSRREGTPTSAMDVQGAHPPERHDSPFSGGLLSSPKSRPTSVVPSAPKTTTEVHTAPSALFDEPTPVIEQPKPRPIGVQPGRAAGMMIPGIHASHQGEVMALGSTPAEKEHAAKEDKSHPDRERTLSQTGRPSSIQNVYRLFGHRTISTSSNDIPRPLTPADVIPQPKAAKSSASIDTISITPIDSEPPEHPFSVTTPRSPPPPLPPRSIPDLMPSSPPPLPPRKMSTASEALKRAVAGDGVVRSGSPQLSELNSGGSTPRESVSRVSSPPPLPPRASVTAG